MAGSSDQGKDLIASFVKDISEIKTVLDIGAGHGTYSKLFKQHDISFDRIDAIEVWKPYIEMFGLHNQYDNVFNVDARSFDDFSYDLVIFGDVLEHMSKEDAQSLWTKAAGQARFGVISIPTVHYHQGPEMGNPFQIHVKPDWSVEEVLESFSNIIKHQEYSLVSVFFADFRKK